MYQQIVLVGHLGDDPELRYTGENVPVCTFPLAVNKQWTDSAGESHEQTTWFRVTAWRRQAEVASEYLCQGRQILVIGEMRPARAYLNKLGEPAASLEVTAHTIKFLGGDAADTGVPVQGSLLEAMDIPI